MTSGSTETVLTRQELYDRVWSTPMRTLAAEFGLSDVGLAKICKRHKIPRPTCGYWAKLEHGKKVEQWPLMAVADKSLLTIHLHKQLTPVESTPKPPVAVDPAIAARIEAELDPANQIEALTDLRGADPLVSATRDSLSNMKPDDYGRVSRRYDFNAPCFDVCVSKANVQRALLLLHTIVRAFRQRGFTLEFDGGRSREPHFDILGRRFSVAIRESSRRQKRELTKAEKEEKAKYSWGVRDYEYVPTGVLELHLNRGSYSSDARIVDTKKAPLEKRLNEVIVRILKDIDRAQVEDERRRQEAQAARLRMQAAVKVEVIRRSDAVREERLLKSIPQWENVVRIRRYIDAVRQEAVRRFGAIDEESEIGRWLHWASGYLESVDPLNDRFELPTFTLTTPELEKLAKECESDWSTYSETFRPRQPR